MTTRGQAAATVASALIAIVLAAGSAAPPATAGTPLEGRPVERIDVAVTGGHGRADLPAHLALRRGAAFTRAALDDALAYLRAKDVFASVTGAATAGPGGGVVVRLDLAPRPVITAIRVRGARVVSPAEVRRRLRIREGDFIDTEAFARSHESVQRFYRDRGYPDVATVIETEPRAPGEMRVWVRVSEGAPQRVLDVVFEGELAAEREALARVVPVHTGEPFAPRALRRGRRAILRHLRTAGRYDARVDGRLEAVGGDVTLHYDGQLGPAYALRVEGNTVLSSERLLAVVDVRDRLLVTEATWRGAAGRMAGLYQEAGHYRATVTPRVVRAPAAEVVFTVDEGPAFTVGSVAFPGRSAVPFDVLRAAVATRVGGLAVDERLADDAEALRRLYAARGFRQARLRRPRAKVDIDTRTVAVSFPVTEGPRTIVATIDVTGAPSELGSPPALATIPERPLDPERLEADRRALLVWLAEGGWIDAAVEPELVPETGGGEPERERVAVHLRVDPGARVRIGPVQVRGNLLTRDRVILRELPVAAGTPFAPEAILRGQSRLRRLGIFRRVSVRREAGPPEATPLTVEVAERPPVGLDYGVGYNTRDGLRGVIDLSHNNVAGRARRVSLRGDLNVDPASFTPDEYAGNLGVTEPHLLDSRYLGRANLIAQRSAREVDEFSQERLALVTAVERELHPGLQAALQLGIEQARVFDVAPDAFLTALDQGDLRLLTLEPILVHDGRDDAFNPRRGVFESLRLRMAAPPLGSNLGLFKVSAQHSHYLPLGEHLVGVYSLRGGYGLAFARSDEVPIRERFFLGGRSTVRGFEENEVGPRGRLGNPTGGDVLFNANVELRFPLPLGLAGAAFVDGGGLYLQRREIAADDFRRSAGLALRYLTPFGPLSLEYGFKLDRRGGESIGEVHFSIGNVF